MIPGIAGHVNSATSLRVAMVTIVEYLVVVPKAGTFCDSPEALRKLLDVDSDLEVRDDRIRLKQGPECGFAVNTAELKEREQRCFHLQFTLDTDDVAKLPAFAELLRAVRTVVAKLSGRVETLWDDLSFHYSKDAYALIHRVENLMRRLIAHFMIVHVGADWQLEAVPGDFKKAIDNSKRKSQENALHSVDFSQLADFLFKPYSTVNESALLQMVRECADMQQLGEVKKLLPQSNWTRYFSQLVHCQDGELSKKWNELYDLRCKVAHNALVSRVDHESIVKLCAELDTILTGAIQKLPQVAVPTKEVAQVVANAAGRLVPGEGNFLTFWALIDRTLKVLAELLDERPSRAFSKLLRQLVEAKLIPERLELEILALRKARNALTHGEWVPDDQRMTKLLSDAGAVLVELVAVAEIHVEQQKRDQRPEVSKSDAE